MYNLFVVTLTGDCDMRRDTWLTSCSDIIASLLSRQQDGLANFVFSALLKTVLSHVSIWIEIIKFSLHLLS